jgi:hypothetical protein
MSINAIRGLVLVANLLLLGLIGWICYGTFVTVDQSHYFVKPPEAKRFAVTDVPVDEKQQQKELYKAISRVFDHPPPPPPPVEAGPKVDKTPAGAPESIKILVINMASDGEGGSALIDAPLASPKEPKFVQVGDDLAALPAFKDHYKTLRLKAITEDEVVFLDTQTGKETKVAGPRGTGGGGGGASSGEGGGDKSDAPAEKSKPDKPGPGGGRGRGGRKGG